MGGTIAVMYASLFPEKLKNLALLTAPVDFAPENTGCLGLWTSEKRLDPDLFVSLSETFRAS
jgi:polyhydroxyalkanoate synthase